MGQMAVLASILFSTNSYLDKQLQLPTDQLIQLLNFPQSLNLMEGLI
jgi:hypothetical protein